MGFIFVYINSLIFIIFVARKKEFGLSVSKIFFSSNLIILALIIAARGIEGGQDPIFYYERMLNLNKFEDIFYYSSYDQFYYIYLFLIGTITENHFVFLLLSAAPSFIIIYHLGVWISKDLGGNKMVFPTLVILLISSSSFIFLEANAFRQNLGLFWLLLGVSLHEKSKFFSHFLVFTSIFFHSSFLPLVTVFYGVRLFPNKYVLSIGIFAAAIIGEQLFQALSNITNLGADAIAYYADYAANENLIFKLVGGVLLLFGLNIVGYRLQHSAGYKILNNLCFSALILSFATFFAPEVSSRYMLNFSVILAVFSTFILARLRQLPLILILQLGYFFFVHTNSSVQYVLQESSLTIGF
jgi:hypothetical protein